MDLMTESAIIWKNYLASVFFKIFIISVLHDMILSKILQNAFKDLLTNANAKLVKSLLFIVYGVGFCFGFS